MEKTKDNIQSSYQWVPSVYLMQGLPFALVTVVSAVLYKNFGFSNSVIAFYTSFFTLPWTIKFLFAPFLEKLTSKRTLTLLMQYTLVVLTLSLALVLYLFSSFYLLGIIFLMMALVSAVHDTSSDGIYLEYLNYTTQAKLIGVRTVFYQLGKLICQGGLLFAVGYFSIANKKLTWSCALALFALFTWLIVLYNQKKLSVYPPVKRKNFSVNTFTTQNTYKNVWLELRQLPHLIIVLIFILIYNLPQAQIMKIIPLFMLDHPAQGGLGLGVEQVGIIYGTLGVISMLLGSTLAGLLLEKFTLKNCLFPFTLLAVLANISYLLLTIYSAHAIWQITSCVLLAEFAYGLTNGAYMLYLVHMFSNRHYAMSLYAIGTAFMQLGMMIGASFSGYLQLAFGYEGFFVWIIVIGLVISSLTFYTVNEIL